jgi:hypothetical protein
MLARANVNHTDPANAVGTIEQTRSYMFGARGF